MKVLASLCRSAECNILDFVNFDWEGTAVGVLSDKRVEGGFGVVLQAGLSDCADEVGLMASYASMISTNTITSGLTTSIGDSSVSRDSRCSAIHRHVIFIAESARPGHLRIPGRRRPEAATDGQDTDTNEEAARISSSISIRRLLNGHRLGSIASTEAYARWHLCTLAG